MNQLDRYIGRQVLMSILAVQGVLWGLSLLFALIDELAFMRAAYGVPEVLEYVLLTSPRRLYELLPMGALIGCLIGLGTLASSSELTVMRASGVPLVRIVGATMAPMLLLMALGLALSEFVMPKTEVLADFKRDIARNGGQALSSKGLWHREGNQYVHINAARSDGVMLGITRFTFDDARVLQESSFAERAEFAGDHWMLHDVVITQLTEQTSEVVHQSTQTWRVELTPQLVSTLITEPDALSISGLWQYARFLGGQGLDSDPYWLAFWSKVLQPLITASLVILAISFIFGPLRSVTLGQRIFTGVLVGFVFRIIQDLLGPASQVFGFSPLLAVALPSVFCALIGLRLLQRAG
ncbi:MAG TPA: LPS export ABC transporter permease LptG [Pseudomonas sp.]|nr:LPS export ABC transporter permease LptG [Pseudomonas sp.]